MNKHAGGNSKPYISTRKMLCIPLLFIIALMVFSMSMTTSMAATAEGTTAEEHTGTREEEAKDIAIVFDNSGTMFLNGNKAWCRAQYAMEVFAAMANEEDEITIYPMNKIDVDGMEYTMDSPLKVDSPSQIHNIYTPPASSGYGGLNTPIESIYRAYEGLMTDADDMGKWLVIVTDGARFYPEGSNSEMSKPETVKELKTLLNSYNDNVNVMYLGINSPGIGDPDDQEAADPELQGTKDYVGEVKIATESSEILEKLTEMCNLMYGRDTLDANHLYADGTVDFDLPMGKLILFVQGSSVANLKLLDEQGKEIDNRVSSYSPQFVTMEGLEADEELSGEIVTYENVPAGTYTLSYEGDASSEEVYYEPNASIYLALTDAEGEDVLTMNGGKIEPGTYQLRYGLKDDDGNLTDSSLLGDRRFTITINGQPAVEDETLQDACGIYPIDLEEGEELYVEVDADYLSGYHAHTDSSTEWAQYPIEVIPEYELSVDIKADAYYAISKLADADPIEVIVTHDGEPLSPEQMELTELTELTLDSRDLDSTDWHVTKDTEHSRFLIEPQAEKTDAGFHKLAAVVTTYDDNYNENVQASTDKTIQFGKYPKWLRWAIFALIVIIILIIIIVIRNQKVLPKQIVIKETKFIVDGTPVTGSAKLKDYKGRKKSSSMTISTPRYDSLAQCSISLVLEAVDPRRVKSSMRAALVKSASVSPVSSIESYKIGAASFVKDPETNSFKRRAKKIKKEDDEKEASLDIQLTNNQKCTINGEVSDEYGMDVPIILVVTLKYL